MQEFFNMGGYGFYVWTSFGLGIASVVYLYYDAKWSNAKKMKQVKIWIARQQKNKEH